MELFAPVRVMETTENLSWWRSGRNRVLFVGGGLRGGKGAVGGEDEGIKDECVPGDRGEDDKVCLLLARKHTHRDTHAHTHTDTQRRTLGRRGCNSLFNYMWQLLSLWSMPLLWQRWQELWRSRQVSLMGGRGEGLPVLVEGKRQGRKLGN